MRTTHNGMKTRDADPVEALRDDLAALRKDVASLVNHGISGMGVQTRRTLHRAGDAVRGLAEQGRTQAGHVHERLADAAASKPLTLIGIALAAGALAAVAAGMCARRH